MLKFARAVTSSMARRSAHTDHRDGKARTVLAMILLLVSGPNLQAQDDPAQEPPPNRGATRSARGGEASPATRPTTNPQARNPGFGGARSGGRAFGGPAARELGEGPTCTFDATVYDVRLPADQIGRLDVDTLVKASNTAEDFEKSLAALGPAKPMYRANQSVRLSGDSIVIGSDVPVITNSRVTDKGQTINSIQYQSTGAIFTLVGKAGAPGGIDVDLSIEVASASDTGAAVSDKVTVPIMRKATLSHRGPVRPGQPFVVVSVDAGSVDKDGKAVAYICRVTLGEPQPPAPR